MIVNFREYENGDVYIVFMIPENGFFRGLLRAQMREDKTALCRFYWAEVEFIFEGDDEGLLEITNVKMLEAAETSPPVF